MKETNNLKSYHKCQSSNPPKTKHPKNNSPVQSLMP